jgi:hypothetical protein
MGYGIPNFEIARELLNFTVGVNEMEPNPKSLSVYPNPLNGSHFSVVLPPGASKQVELKLFDMSGRMVYSDQLQRGELSLLAINLDQRLESGIYTLAIFDKSNQNIGNAKIVAP